MQIRHVIIKVDEQDKALSIYTATVGFVKRLDLPIGRVRWLGILAGRSCGRSISAGTEQLCTSADGTKALYDASFPAAVLTPTDIAAEYQRLKSLGVTFRG